MLAPCIWLTRANCGHETAASAVIFTEMSFQNDSESILTTSLNCNNCSREHDGKEICKWKSYANKKAEVKIREQNKKVFHIDCFVYGSGNSSFSHQRFCKDFFFLTKHSIYHIVFTVKMVVVQTKNEKLWGQDKGRAAGRRKCSSNCQSVTIYHLRKSSK